MGRAFPPSLGDLPIEVRRLPTTISSRETRQARELLAPPTLDAHRPVLYIQCRYMAATTQIAKWGNSLGVRLPKSVALEADIEAGDAVDVSVENGAIVIRPSRPTYSLEELVGSITSRNRHGESDWGEAVGHETW